MKSYKFRIYPNKQQVQILSQTIETCRSLYNQSLEERLKDKGLKYYEQKRNLTQKRKVIASLKRVHSQVLQNVVWRLERAFQNYHRDRKIGQPNFKRHGRYNSITYPQYGSFCIKENKLKLAFVDGLIKLKLHRPFVAEKIKTCTIVRDIDRWFACFSCNNDIQKSSSSDIVGVDVGLLNWMMLSNGEIIDRPRFLGASTERVKRLQRSVSRKKKGSRNREKARIQLAKSWRKVRLQRDDYCQKITTSLAKRFGKIVFEKLSIDKMVKNHNLAQSILDSTWYRIRQLAACKAEVIIVDPSNTTQRCSCCGSMPEKKIDLKVRVYKCSSCGLVLNRDHNAALEILRKGLEQTHIEKLPLLDKTSKLFRGSMKPTSFMSG
jgi:putative transposase